MENFGRQKEEFFRREFNFSGSDKGELIIATQK